MNSVHKVCCRLLWSQRLCVVHHRLLIILIPDDPVLIMYIDIIRLPCTHKSAAFCIPCMINDYFYIHIITIRDIVLYCLRHDDRFPRYDRNRFFFPAVCQCHRLIPDHRDSHTLNGNICHCLFTFCIQSCKRSANHRCQDQYCSDSHKHVFFLHSPSPPLIH